MADVGAIVAFLKSGQIPYRLNEPLYSYTTFRLGGPADVLAMPQNSEQLAAIQQFVNKHNLPVLVIGGGSNLLIADTGIRGLVVHPQFGEEITVVHQSSDRIVVQVPASARAPLTGKRISSLGYGGLEFLTTIPGHFGGSVIQNAGCYGHELRDFLLSVEVAYSGKIANLKQAECGFAYRDSIFKKDSAYWVAGATLELYADDPSQIEQRIADYKARRIASQPKNRRSAGSIFKNPASNHCGKKAWELIDAAGLRGVRRGSAEISTEHCNFIVNNGQAKAADVLYLIELIEQRVFEQSGIQLEREVVLAGFPAQA